MGLPCAVNRTKIKACSPVKRASNMNPPRASVVAAVTIGMLCVIAGLLVVKNKPENASPVAQLTQAEQPQAGREAAASELRTRIAELAQPTPIRDDTRAPKSPKASSQAKTNAPGAATRSIAAGPTKQPLKDPVARIALAWVGVDPAAEAYWYEAINDPNLPPNERQDLIEDLNEDGLSDPKHPTVGDLPLIIRRLAIIEEVVPNAIDQVNADAFQEAYKDLVNLANVAMGGGEPVR
jgi:hypothetical protein